MRVCLNTRRDRAFNSEANRNRCSHCDGGPSSRTSASTGRGSDAAGRHRRRRAASAAIDASPLLRGRQRLGCKDLLRGAVESAPKPPRSTSWTPSRALVLTTAPLHVMWPRADRGGGHHLPRDGAVVSRASSTALGRDFRRDVPTPRAYDAPRIVATSAAYAGRCRVGAATLSLALGMLAVAPIVPCRTQVLDATGAAPKKETTRTARSWPLLGVGAAAGLHSRGLLWTRRRRGPRRSRDGDGLRSWPPRREAHGLVARSRRSPRP